MAVAAKRSKLSRHWGPVLATGGAGLMLGAGAVIAFGRDWLVQALAQASPASAGLMIGAVGAEQRFALVLSAP